MQELTGEWVAKKEFEDLHDSLRHLESYSVAVRYPGITVSVPMAEQALTLATEVRRFIRKKLFLQ